MSRPKIGMVGLALSHPYTFAQVLTQLGAEVAWVWDDRPDRAEAFAAQYGARVVASPADMAAESPDGVMVCGIAANHVRDSLPFLERSIPTFIDRPLAVSHADLAVFNRDLPLMSTSILRYGEAFAPLRNATGTVLGATATICHSIEAYLKPGNTWQDEPELGGGSIMTMGQHGLELIASVLGAGWRSVHAVAARRHFTASRSEDVAAITLQYDDGRIATVNVICGTKAHGYSLTLFTSEGVLEAKAPSGAADPLADYGYTGTVREFLRMVGTRRPPIPLAETHAITAALLQARSACPPPGRP